MRGSMKYIAVNAPLNNLLAMKALKEANQTSDTSEAKNEAVHLSIVTLNFKFNINLRKIIRQTNIVNIEL